MILIFSSALVWARISTCSSTFSLMAAAMVLTYAEVDDAGFRAARGRTNVTTAEPRRIWLAHFPTHDRNGIVLFR
jgi:hypothetical protein